MTTKLVPLLALCALGACAQDAWAQADTAAAAPAASSAAAPGAPAAATDNAAAGAHADAAAAAPPAPTAPQLVATDKISAGDTAWMLTSTALVLMMTIPGLALFYAGMVRKKNILATVMQSFAITCLVTLLWWVVGYSWAFTPGSSPYLGGMSRLLMHGMTFMKDDGKLTVSHLALTSSVQWAMASVHVGQRLCRA